MKGNKVKGIAKTALRAAAFMMTLVMLAGVFASVGCFTYYDPSQQSGQSGQNDQSGQSGISDLFTVPPEEATNAPVATDRPSDPTAAPTAGPTECPVREDGKYDTKDEVALYIRLYGHLPSNYIKKSKAQELGWQGGSLEPYAPGCSIGGDRFGNYEGLLPKKSGRYYTECDIGTKGKSSRGSKRIVYSNDGLIYYTGDHYESFTLLYGGD